MSNKPFYYQNPFPLAKDDTEYYLLSRDHVSVANFDGEEVLKVDPKALTLLAQQQLGNRRQRRAADLPGHRYRHHHG
jgi:hypothetical protein